MYASNAEQNGQIRSYKCPCCSNKFPNADLWKKHVDVCVQPRSRVSPNQPQERQSRPLIKTYPPNIQRKAPEIIDPQPVKQNRRLTEPQQRRGPSPTRMGAAATPPRPRAQSRAASRTGRSVSRPREVNFPENGARFRVIFEQRNRSKGICRIEGFKYEWKVAMQANGLSGPRAYCLDCLRVAGKAGLKGPRPTTFGYLCYKDDFFYGNPDLPNDQPHFCTQPSQSNLQNVPKRLDDHSVPRRPSDLNASDASSSSSKTQQQMDKYPLKKCPGCKEKFENVEDCYKHLKECFPSSYGDFVCQICGENFDRRRDLFRHTVDCHLEAFCGLRMQQDTPNSSPAQAKPGVPCPICEKRFKVYANLIDHVRECCDNDTQSFKCKLCPSEVSTRASFNNHCRQKHSALFTDNSLIPPSQRAIRARSRSRTNGSTLVRTEFAKPPPPPMESHQSPEKSPEAPKRKIPTMAPILKKRPSIAMQEELPAVNLATSPSSSASDDPMDESFGSSAAPSLDLTPNQQASRSSIESISAQSRSNQTISRPRPPLIPIQNQGPGVLRPVKIEIVSEPASGQLSSLSGIVNLDLSIDSSFSSQNGVVRIVSSGRFTKDVEVVDALQKEVYPHCDDTAPVRQREDPEKFHRNDVNGIVERIGLELRKIQRDSNGSERCLILADTLLKGLKEQIFVNAPILNLEFPFIPSFLNKPQVQPHLLKLLKGLSISTIIYFLGYDLIRASKYDDIQEVINKLSNSLSDLMETVKNGPPNDQKTIVFSTVPEVGYNPTIFH